MKSFIIMLAIVCSGMSLYALPDIREAKNWITHFSSSGKMEFNWDEEAEAMNIQVAFPENVKDHWVYPALVLSPEDKKADFLEFEIKVEANPDNRGFRNCLVFFQTPQWKNLGQFYYAKPGKEFKKVRIDLRKSKIDLSKARIVRIGLNFNDAAEGAVWLKNIKFTKAENAAK